jgi:signal transduction histidine kinase/ligand-binding sensor domain-containing protein
MNMKAFPALRAALGLVCATLGAQHLPVHILTAAQGLPRNIMGCLTPGLNGIMWMCSSEGLARFDGHTLRVFGTAEGLPSSVISDIEPARGGGYWIATDRGVCRLEAGSEIGQPCRLFTNTAGANLEHSDVYDFAGAGAWLATSSALFRLDPVRRTVEPSGFVLPREDLFTLADGPNGDLLIGTERGIYEWTTGQPPRKLNAAFGNFGVTSIVRFTAEDYWLGGERGIFGLHLDESTDQPVFHPDLLKGYVYIESLYRSRGGKLWATSFRKLLELTVEAAYQPKVLAEFNHDQGLPDARITAIAEDTSGGVWGATDGAGVFRLDPSGISAYDAAEGLHSARIASIFADRTGKLCVMITPDGHNDLHVFDGRKFQAVHVPYPAGVIGAGWGWNQLGLQAADGEWWFPSPLGLLRYPSSTIAALPDARLKAKYSRASGLGCDVVFRTYQDSAGDLWVACLDNDSSIMRWDRHSDKFVRYPIGPPGSNTGVWVLVIREAGPGRYWLGTNRGLFRLNQGRFDPVSVEDAKQTFTFRDVLFDHEGRLWAGSSLHGLFRCDRPNDAEPAFVRYGVGEALSANSVRALAEDRSGFIYACTVRGVDRLDPRAAAGEHRIRHFTAADGLPDSETNAAFTDSAGRIWVGSLRGLACIDPAQGSRFSSPEALITRLRVRGEDLPVEWEGSKNLSFQLGSDRNQLEISYAATDSRSAAAVRFQYRLSGASRWTGASSNWSEPSDQLVVNYPALPSGRLRFEVRGVNADGQVGAKVAGVDLDVLAPIWQRWWFLVLLGAALTALGSSLYLARVRQLLAIANLRTHIATDLHDDIGASLTQIAILSEVAHRDPSTHLLQEISAIARNTVAEMSDIVWAVNPRHDRFESLLHRMRRFAEDTLSAAGIEVVFDTAGLDTSAAFPLEARRPLFLIFKEAIHNIARHSHATHVWAAFDLDRTHFRLIVDDDGCGFDIHERHDGEGIASVSRRAERLGGTAQWTSRPGSGTRLSVTIPASRPRVPQRNGNS